ncbi:LON peptidase substrate-binding domain-containing protein [Marinicellulosiphila megalodicopiae]|uniref:LON peptidase substrate-binding domain-containing protein n=1 Tax=Marinicellulosiphila megalodicopiae TaxID=2724896 RepID=UPI003BB1B374
MMTPLFPLHIPLMPHCECKIKVFEQRYLNMISQTMRSDSTFVITQILKGSEIHQPNQSIEFSNFGCMVKIKDFNQNDSLELLLEATQLVKIINPVQSISGLWESKINVLPFTHTEIDVATHQLLITLYDTLKQHPYLQRQSLLPDTSNSLQLLNFLCMWLPLNEEVRIKLMQANNTVLRAQCLFESLEAIEQDFSGF